MTGAMQIIIAAGTYDGGLASYRIQLRPERDMEMDDDHDDDNDDDDDDETDNRAINKLEILFASPVHQGSVRSLTVARSAGGGGGGGGAAAAAASASPKSSSSSAPSNGLLLSTGYDETLKTHDFGKHLSSSGEVRTPADFGTPYCSAFAPPHGGILDGSALSGGTGSTHCLVGFGAAVSSSDDGTTTTSTGGKLVIYKKRDWSVQHVLAGHDGGIASIAVHPTGKLALSGGQQDGKLKLWDLERGRLAFSSPTIRKSTGGGTGKNVYESIDCIAWNSSNGGDCYAFCHGSHITVRDVQTGKDLLDVDLPSKVNQVCLLQGPEGLFVAAACNDGSLPVLAVELHDIDTNAEDERRAIMAIEPVDGPVAGEERYKCIQAIVGYYVATANSAGVVSLMNLQGAVNMLTSTDPAADNDGNGDDDDDEEEDVEVDSDDDEDDEDETELAVDIIDSVLLGNKSRITCLAAWVSSAASSASKDDGNKRNDTVDEASVPIPPDQRKSRQDSKATQQVVLDPESLSRARALVSKAKQIQKRKTDKKHKLAKQRIK